ncbi:dTMP kinase [Streptosporangium algeriense]|uniref:Thymidylate kinase n=1 Tax=Streptosporangium algeriense TaxID=1682748 RepID=A0ABW3E0P5_9ACTN
MALPLYDHDLPGTFIAFCGMDGSGKTSLIEGLSKRLASGGVEPVVTMQPSRYARESPLFTRYIYHPEERHQVDYRALICLLTSDRLQNLHEVVLPALREGRTVITDRYVFTALAQMRARGFANEEWFFEICKHVPRPDLTLLCDPGFQVSQGRVGRRTDWRDSYIEADHDQQLYMNYQIVADEEGLVRFDTNLPVEESLDLLYGVVNDRLPNLLG